MRKDHLFGDIYYEDLWIGTTEITMYGKKKSVSLNIYGEEDEEITANQRDAFSHFQANMLRIISEGEHEVYNYYLKNFEDFRAMRSSEEAESIAPRISSIEDLGAIVKPTCLLIRYDFEDGVRRVGILCDCTWDPEHGLGIRIENEKVVEVGLQDIVL